MARSDEHNRRPDAKGVEELRKRLANLAKDKEYQAHLQKEANRRGYEHEKYLNEKIRKERSGVAGSAGCYDDAGNIIADCMDRMKREESDWQHMRNQQRKPATSTNGHSDMEHERGTNVRDDSIHPLPPYGLQNFRPMRNVPLEEREFPDYMDWKHKTSGARRSLFRGKPRDWRSRRGDEDEGSMAV